MNLIEAPDRADTEFAPSQRRDWAVWRFCAWSGPFFVFAFFIAWYGIASFFPPPSENWDADRVVEFFDDNSVGIRLGLALSIFLSVFYLFWTLAIARVMKTMDGVRSQPLTRLQVFGGFSTALVIILFSLLWVVAAFEVGEREPDPRTVQLLHDAGWITFQIVGMPTIVQMCALGIVLIGERDNGVPQLMPRWVAYLGFWVSFSFLAEFLMLYIKTGPVAWHGAVCYYVVLFSFVSWIGVVSFYTIKANRLLESEERSIAKPEDISLRTGGLAG